MLVCSGSNIKVLHKDATPTVAHRHTRLPPLAAFDFYEIFILLLDNSYGHVTKSVVKIASKICSKKIVKKKHLKVFFFCKNVKNQRKLASFDVKKNES